jgi:hypothetical protein
MEELLHSSFLLSVLLIAIELPLVYGLFYFFLTKISQWEEFDNDRRYVNGLVIFSVIMCIVLLPEAASLAANIDNVTFGDTNIAVHNLADQIIQK